MQMEESITFWSEVKDIFKQISEKFDTVWQKRKRVLSTQLLVTFILKLGKHPLI